MDLSSDQLSIDTPELVTIEMPLAGIGSRFIALLVDYLIMGAALVLLILLAVVLLPALEVFNKISEQWAEAILIFLLFLFGWGYFTLFEAFWNGRTPGKKVAKIRVIHRSGRSIGLLESMARNLVRYVDMQPGILYGVGVITMFVTSQHQRLGDLAAGTLVVRDREPETPLWGESGSRTFTAQLFTSAPPEEPQRPGGAGGVLRAAAGHEPGHPRDAGWADCGSDPGQVRVGTTAGGECGDFS
jgi:uncharacterized RDD family membrane protein YckC